MHHHVAPLIGLWASLFTSMIGSWIAILAGLQARRRREARFDPIASARRIRTMPLRVSKRR
jgi:hypothetical protein